MQVLWRPSATLSLLGNQYYGTDTFGNGERKRFHSDNSIMARYRSDPDGTVSKGAFSVTIDAGCEWGGGVSCPTQYFLGFMAYNRLWFARDRFGLTLGGGGITNPGRYLVLLPPINGATASSGTPYFTANPGDGFNAWDLQATFDYMPDPYMTFRFEFNHRAANTPYFAGRNGMTPPGGNQGGAGAEVPGWIPDLRKTESRLTAAMLLKL